MGCRGDEQSADLDTVVRFAHRRAGRWLAVLASYVLAFVPAPAVFAADELEELRRQIEEQESLISAQAQALAEQQDRIERQHEALQALGDQVERLAAERAAPSERASEPDEPDEPHEPAEETTAYAGVRRAGIQRDGVGDLNRRPVREGDFPGAILIPGPWQTSLRIGGFVKVLSIYDTDAENLGAAFTPAALGTRRSDDDGRTSFDATLSRVLLDARAPTPWGPVRGYVELDLNNTNDGDLDVQYRHAYGTLETEYGTALAGQTWSTFMDLRILPEGLAEPTVSGVIFQRQALFRWTHRLGSSLLFHVAAERPTSDDVFSDDPDPDLFNTEYPDGVFGIEYVDEGRWHLRLNSLLRNLTVNLPAGGEGSETAWGLALSGSLRLFERDQIAFSGIYGEGLGRYLLGVASTAGASISTEGDNLTLNENWGVMGTYRHYWLDDLRSSVMGGYAYAERPGVGTASTFKSTAYASGNLLWNVFPFLTVGIEYAYGRRDNRSASDFDNHRVLLGVQIF